MEPLEKVQRFLLVESNLKIKVAGSKAVIGVVYRESKRKHEEEYQNGRKVSTYSEIRE